MSSKKNAQIEDGNEEEKIVTTYVEKSYVLWNFELIKFKIIETL